MFFLLLVTHGIAQDKGRYTFGKLVPADFTLPAKAIIDSDANAVILSDIGEAHFVGNNKNWFSLVYKRQTRIRIINKKAFDLATVTVPLYSPKDGDAEKLSEVAAAAYNLENGQVVPTRLDQKDIFQNRENNWTAANFSVPGVKEGSILEYTYTITSDYYRYLRSWEFQWERYPCLSSEFRVDIPQTISYVLVKQGVHPYAVDKGSEGRNSYKVTEKIEAGLSNVAEDKIVSVATVKHDWVMKDIPAFGSETYLTTPDNYLDKLSFQESRTYNGEETFSHTDTWAKATQELLEEEQFGGTLNENNETINELADKINAPGRDNLAQARAVFYYVSQHFTCTNHYDFYIRTSLRDAIRKNSGTVGEINLLLVGLLRRKGMEADPVLLSTREHGFSMVSYPVLEKFNYVIARVKIDGQVYYLDAAQPQLGFGRLAGNCYNGHARIISNKDSGSVYLAADSLQEKKTTVVFISSADKAEVAAWEGTWEATLGPQQSYELRENVSKQGEKSYFKSIQTQYGEDISIGDAGVDSLDQPEQPVKVHYSFKVHSGEDRAKIYLNPFIGAGLRTNPFKAADRRYPVEMPYVTDETYFFTMQIPDGYTVEELPKSAKARLNERDGSFEYLIGADAGMIQLRCRLKLNKANFVPEDYSGLRDFYALVVQKEAETIVLKKN
jgi:hypothetical protein